MHTRIDQQIGNFRLTKFLGGGSFGDVYLGRNMHMGMLVAIKILKRNVDEEYAKCFLKKHKLSLI